MADPFLAEIVMFGGNFAPSGWAFCDGQLLSISQNSALFSILGTTFGGDGEVTFGLPDLRGRIPMHVGNSQGPGLSQVNLGQKGGSELGGATIAVGNLPAHSHVSQVSSSDATGGTAGVVAAGEDIFRPTGDPGTLVDSVPTKNTGSGSALSFSIRNPFQGINFIIAIVGTFPSQN